MTPEDLALVTDLLGRAPNGACEIAVRDAGGAPVVIHNAPHMHDGRPMPTSYWLVGRREHDAVSRLEASGGVKAAEQAADPALVAEAHARYESERAALATRLQAASGVTHEHQPSGGVGGTRHGVKCLHAHLAWHLAGGDDPVGRWTAAELEIDRSAYTVEVTAPTGALEAPGGS